MRTLFLLATALSWASFMAGQTASELVAKNLEARGGLEKIKAIKTLRMIGKMQQGSLVFQVEQTAMEPNLLRQGLTIQGMTETTAYDGSSGWKVSPFEGRRDPELLGEEETREMTEQADFYGPLVDYGNKDNRIEYFGHDTIDGDDVYRLKVTLANGDIIYYYLDPDTYLEIRTEKMQFVRGAVRESITNLGSYKKVDGVYFPFSFELGSARQDPNSFAKVTLSKIEANVPVDRSQFKRPVANSAASSGKPSGKGML